MNKVGGPIQGINHPGVGFPPRGIGSLFGNESCLRKNRLQLSYQLLFGFLVHIGDQVVETLVLHPIHGKMKSLFFDKCSHLLGNFSSLVQELGKLG